jgi:putative nucleotidyltransferase with HDIG domain
LAITSIEPVAAERSPTNVPIRHPASASQTDQHLRTATEVLLVMDDPDDLAVARAVLHLIGLPVRAASTFHVVCSQPFAQAPILLIYDDKIPARSLVEDELLATFRHRTTPLLALSDSPGLPVPEPHLQRPFTPLMLLGAASRAQPRLYEYATDIIEPDLNEKLLLITHDLRRATREEHGEPGSPVAVSHARGAFVQASLSLLEILKLRDIETAMHCYRVQAYAQRLAQRINPAILDDDTINLGFLLHDIGKLALPDSILQKPGPLTPAERQLMQTHPLIGAQTCRFLEPGRGVNVIRSHHERWDGNGYPDGLEGAAIPLEARVFAAADALDALTSDRPYRAATPWPQALRVLSDAAETHFDPLVIESLEQEANHLRTLGRQLTAATTQWPV